MNAFGLQSANKIILLMERSSPVIMLKCQKYSRNAIYSQGSHNISHVPNSKGSKLPVLSLIPAKISINGEVDFPPTDKNYNNFLAKNQVRPTIYERGDGIKIPYNPSLKKNSSKMQQDADIPKQQHNNQNKQELKVEDTHYKGNNISQNTNDSNIINISANTIFTNNYIEEPSNQVEQSILEIEESRESRDCIDESSNWRRNNASNEENSEYYCKTTKRTNVKKAENNMLKHTYEKSSYERAARAKTVEKIDLIRKKVLMRQREEEFELDQSSQEEQDQQVIKSSHNAYLINSPFEGRPPTFYFKNPLLKNTLGPPQNCTLYDGKDRLYYRIHGSEYKCITNIFEFNGFQSTYDKDFAVFFNVRGCSSKTFQTLQKYQKFNHFPGCWSLGRKDQLYRCINRMKRTHGSAYNFIPMTYILPSDYDRFEIMRELAAKSKLWILKPSNRACGRGIKMVSKDTKIRNRKDTLISEYIADPHLINNHKYDLRIYTLVSCFDPLRIYVFQEGLVRFATYEYTAKLSELNKRFIHLTNFSVNKYSKKFVKNKNADADNQGSKWSTQALLRHFQANGINGDQIFNKIEDIIIKTCISVEPYMLSIDSKTNERRNCCFQIFGFDILIDNNLKPWLIEVNVCPSLCSSSPMDRRIKHALLADTLNLIGVSPFSKKQFSLFKKKEKQRSLYYRLDKKVFSRNISNLQTLNYNNSIDTLSPQDWLVLFEYEEEQERKGNFKCIFPLRENCVKYEQYFEIKRYSNILLKKALLSQKPLLQKLYEQFSPLQ